MLGDLSRLARPRPQNIGDSPTPGDPSNPGNTGFGPGGGGEHPLGGGGGGGPYLPPQDKNHWEPGDPDVTPQPSYMHSLATHSLRQAGYNPYQANQLIRLARHQGLGGFQQGPGGAYHDPTQTTYDPTPPTGKTSAGFTDWSSDPNPSDTRAAQPTDPNYYGGFKSPGVQQGLEAVSARWAPKRAARAVRQAARGPR